MTAPLLGVCVLIAAAPSAGSGLPTDRLEAYAEQVAINRMNCGPTALWYCLRQFGYDVDRRSICRDADLRADGATLESLLRVSDACGVPARGITIPAKDLSILPVPSIIVVDQTHCVVFQGFDVDGDTVRFFEPATGRNLIAPRERVMRSWTGEAIVFERPRLSTSVFWGITACAAVVTGSLVTGVLRVVSGRGNPLTTSEGSASVAEVR